MNEEEYLVLFSTAAHVASSLEDAEKHAMMLARADPDNVVLVVKLVLEFYTQVKHEVIVRRHDDGQRNTITTEVGGFKEVVRTHNEQDSCHQ